MLVVYKLVQIGAFFSFISLGIIRIFDDNFPFTIFLSCLSVLVTLLILLFTTKTKIENSSKLWSKKKKNRIQLIELLMLLTLVIGIIALIWLTYYKNMETKYSDALSIFALGISLSNDILSNWLSRLFSISFTRSIEIPK
jgi:divalent metal cation (Fe/Co/Zn/Cd) transporter